MPRTSMTRMVWSPSAVSVASMASSNGCAPRPLRQDSSVSLVVTSSRRGGSHASTRPVVRCRSSGAPSLAFPPGYLGVQGIEPVFPQGPVPAQPGVDLGEGLRAQGVDAALGLLADLDQARFAQHAQVA